MIKQAAIVLAAIAITACGEEKVATAPAAPVTDATAEVEMVVTPASDAQAETTGEIVLAETAEMAEKMMAEAALIEAQAETTIEEAQEATEESPAAEAAPAEATPATDTVATGEVEG